MSVKNSNGDTIAKYRFKNIELPYANQYINWKNLDFCGGWNYSEDELVHQYLDSKKLFVDITFNIYTPNNTTAKLVIQCEDLKDTTVLELGEEDEFATYAISKKGCLADYIDIHGVIESYYALGLYELPIQSISMLEDLANEELISYAKPEMNIFGFDYANPKGLVEIIFAGLLLGYPIESTASLLGL